MYAYENSDREIEDELMPNVKVQRKSKVQITNLLKKKYLLFDFNVKTDPFLFFSRLDPVSLQASTTFLPH